MSYATLEQLMVKPGERVLVELTDRASPPSGVVDQAAVAKVLADTDALIDGYLAGRYVLPLAETPPLLAAIALPIAFYKLHNYAPEGKVQKDYEDALAQLKQIGTGVIRLPIAGVEPASSDAGGVVATDRPRDFTPENMRGFI